MSFAQQFAWTSGQNGGEQVIFTVPAGLVRIVQYVAVHNAGSGEPSLALKVGPSGSLLEYASGIIQPRETPQFAGGNLVLLENQQLVAESAAGADLRYFVSGFEETIAGTIQNQFFLGAGLNAVDQVLFTVPAGKRRVVMYLFIFNRSTTSFRPATVKIGPAGSYLDWYFDDLAPLDFAEFNGASLPLDPGQDLVVNADNGSDLTILCSGYDEDV